MEENEIITDTTDTTEATTTPEKTGRTFTQKDIDTIISERLKKERKNFEKEKSEAERLASLSAEEKEREKFKIEKEQFENEKKLLTREKMQIQAARELEKLEIPSSLAKFIIADEADAVQQNIKELTTAWKKSLDDAVNKRIAGATPKSGNTINTEENEMKNKIFAAAGIKL